MWWLNAEEGMVKRKGITRFQKCRPWESITENVKLGAIKQTIACV
jgi:hypothetical protein